MFKATVNQETSHELDVSPKQIQLDGQPFHWDIKKINDRLFHIIYKNQSFNLEVIDADYKHKDFRFKINGKPCDVHLQTQLDLLIDQLGFQQEAADNQLVIKAPMPGLILQLHIEEGATIKKDDPLLTLEAMKMENVIKAPKDGTITSVKIKKGESVVKNQILIEY